MNEGQRHTLTFDARLAVRRHIKARNALALTTALVDAIGRASWRWSRCRHTAITIHGWLKPILALAGLAIFGDAAVDWARQGCKKMQVKKCTERNTYI